MAVDYLQSPSLELGELIILTIVDRKGLEPFLLACKANVLAYYH